MITHTPLLAGYLLIKTLVARQQPTNRYILLHKLNLPTWSISGTCKLPLAMSLSLQNWIFYIYIDLSTMFIITGAYPPPDDCRDPSRHPKFGSQLELFVRNGVGNDQKLGVRTTQPGMKE